MADSGAHMKRQAKTRRDMYRQRTAAFEFLRFRRHGYSWAEAKKLSGVSREIVQRLFPRAFLRDRGGHLQVRGYDPYTRKVKISTTKPGEFIWLSARGSRKASLVGTWNNALKAAGQGDFSAIDAFPRSISVDGVHLVTSHDEVSRIAAAVAESDKPFEELYALAGSV